MNQDHPTDEQLAAFDRGQLSGFDSEVVESHVAECTECCRRLESLPDGTLAQLVRDGAIDNKETLAQPIDSDSRVPRELLEHPRYRITGCLGRGGMGVVFRAEHRLMERTVALKVINERLVANAGAVERFRQEVKAAARLAHPNIVVAHDAEQAGDIHFLVMELVDGASLDQLVRRQGTLPIGQACATVRQAALGLDHAFEKGMVHRDIKPGNLMLTSSDVVKVLDFGLSRFVSELAATAPLTSSGTVLGTPDYIAPEQATDPRTADTRADIYSLGCTLYHLLVGHPPFPGGTALQTLIAHRERAPRTLISLRPDVPLELSRIVERMMAKEPSHRYATPGLVAAALAPFTSHSPSTTVIPPRRRRTTRRLVIASLFGLALVAAGIALTFLPKSDPAPPLAEAPPATELTVLASQPIPAGTASLPPATASTTLTIQRPKLPTIVSRPPLAFKIGLEPKQRRAEMIAWFDENNRDGNKSKLAAKWGGDLSAITNTEDDLYVGLGPKLLKSERTTYVAVYGDGFYAFELTPEEAKRTGIRDFGSQLDSVKHEEPRRVQYELKTLTVTNHPTAVHKTTLYGLCQFKRLADKPDDKLTIRIYRRMDRKGEVVYSDLPRGLSQPTGRLAISAVWDVAVKEAEKGPILLFVELCAFTEPGDYKKLTVISNAVAALVDVIPAAEKPPP